MNNFDTPIKMFEWPNDHDPIVEIFHNGNHCLFYDPEFKQATITYRQKLHDLGEWANDSIRTLGIDQFFANTNNHYDIANLVKLNMWIHDIRCNGIVKPMLIWYLGNEKYIATNGESRLRALESIPEIVSVRAFISTTAEHADKFKHLIPVTTFDQFAELCPAESGQKFLFRLADSDASYGIDWFEYDSRRTAKVTPDEAWCVSAIIEYLNQYPGTEFTVSWFNQPIDWNLYKSS